MAEATQVDVGKLREIAKKIGSLMEEHEGVFSALSQHSPNAGAFDTARWVEDLFADRRDGIVQHAKYMTLVLTEMQEGLDRIATEFEGVDAANGDALSKFDEKAKSIVGDMSKVEFEKKLLGEPKDYDSGDNGEVTEEEKKKDFFTSDDPQDTTNEETTDPPPETPPATHPTGANFDPKNEPDEKVYIKHQEHNSEGKTYRSYDIDGSYQTDGQGRQIYWYNGIAYYRDWDEINSMTRVTT